MIAWTATDSLMSLVAVCLVLVVAVMSAVESGLVRTSVAKATSLIEDGRRGAERLARVLADAPRYLNPVLFVGLSSQVVHAALVGIVAARWLGLGWALLVIAADVLVVYVVADAVPRTWALQHPENAAIAGSAVASVVGVIAPVRWLTAAFIALTNAIVPGRGPDQGPWITDREILALAAEAVTESVIEDDERHLIESIIDFGDTVAREIMVPRTDMVTLEDSFAVGDVVEIALLNGLSRFPVYRESVDDIVGVVFTKDLLRAERDGRDGDAISSLMRTALFVPETKRVSELLREMQSRKTHMAIVIDEYGGTAGLVTMEDLLEELVGEIHDEFDVEERVADRLANGDVVVSDPSVNVDDVNDRFQLALPEGDWDSVGGLVFSQLGRVAEVGDVVDVERYRLVVESVEGRRVGRVRIVAIPQPAEEPAS